MKGLSQHDKQHFNFEKKKKGVIVELYVFC